MAERSLKPSELAGPRPDTQWETEGTHVLSNAGLTSDILRGIMGHGGGDRRGAASHALEFLPFQQLELFPLLEVYHEKACAPERKDRQ